MMKKENYVKPKVELLIVQIEQSITNTSIQVGGEDSTPVVEDWVDESNSQHYFFD